MSVCALPPGPLARLPRRRLLHPTPPLSLSLPPSPRSLSLSVCPQADAVDCATQALEKYNIEKDIAAYIKREFDKKYNPTWHCIVGRCGVQRQTKMGRGSAGSAGFVAPSTDGRWTWG